MTSKLATVLGTLALLAAAVALFALGASSEVVGLLVAAAVGGAGVAHRGVWQRVPDHAPPEASKVRHLKGPRGDGGAGFATLEALLAALAAAILLLLAGCGPVVVSSGRVQIDPLAGGGAVVIATDSAGAEAGRVEVRKLTSPISIPGSLLCDTIRGVLLSYGADRAAADKWMGEHTKCAVSP